MDMTDYPIGNYFTLELTFEKDGVTIDTGWPIFASEFIDRDNNFDENVQAQVKDVIESGVKYGKNDPNYGMIIYDEDGNPIRKITDSDQKVTWKLIPKYGYLPML